MVQIHAHKDITRYSSLHIHLLKYHSKNDSKCIFRCQGVWFLQLRSPHSQSQTQNVRDEFGDEGFSLLVLHLLRWFERRSKLKVVFWCTFCDFCGIVDMILIDSFICSRNVCGNCAGVPAVECTSSMLGVGTACRDFCGFPIFCCLGHWIPFHPLDEPSPVHPPDQKNHIMGPHMGGPYDTKYHATIHAHIKHMSKSLIKHAPRNGSYRSHQKPKPLRWHFSIRCNGRPGFDGFDLFPFLPRVVTVLTKAGC